MNESTLSARAPEVIAPGSGFHHHFLDHLATVKVRGEHGALSVVEFVARRGSGAPLHVHDHEDELFVVLSGELMFYTGDDQIPAGAGAIAHLPHGIPHMFQVVSNEARMVCVTGSVTGSPQFDAMVAALGTPIDEPSLPVNPVIDPAQVAEICGAHGVPILGPPPAPLD